MCNLLLFTAADQRARCCLYSHSASAGVVCQNRDRRREEEEMSGCNKESCGMNYWGFDMEGWETGWTALLRQGIAHPPQTHAKHTHTCTHIQTRKTQLLGALCVDVLMESPRHRDWATQEPALPRFPTQKQAESTRITAPGPNWHVAILTKNTPTPWVSPPFPIHFSAKCGGNSMVRK